MATEAARSRYSVIKLWPNHAAPLVAKLTR